MAKISLPFPNGGISNTCPRNSGQNLFMGDCCKLTQAIDRVWCLSGDRYPSWIGDQQNKDFGGDNWIFDPWIADASQHLLVTIGITLVRIK